MNQYNKTPGSALFWGNRTKQPFRNESHSYTPRCIVPIVGYVFRYKKTNISIQPDSSINPAGGFLIYPSYCPIAYESVEVGTGEEGSGYLGDATITVGSGVFQHLDKITIGGKSITLVTNGSGGGYYNSNIWNISTGPLSTQMGEILSGLQNSYSYNFIPDSNKVNFYSINSSTSLYIRSKFLNTTADNLPIGVVSSNPAITVTSGQAVVSKAEFTIQNIKFKAFTGGSAGNVINIAYTTGASTSTPEISVNAGNSVDIKIQSGVTTAQQIIDGVLANSSVNTLITAELASGLSSNTQTSPVSSTFLDGGTSHRMKNWIRGDKLKNCFIPSQKVMYGYNDSNASSITVNEMFIPVNTTVFQSYHALQVLSHPNYNYAAWFRKNVAKAATARCTGTNSYPNEYNSFEVELKIPGTIGNTYTFEVRLNPGMGQSGALAINPRFRLENAGKRIVLVHGMEAGGTIRALTDMNMLYDAINNGDAGVKDLIKVNVNSTYLGMNSAESERPFSGGTDSAGSDYIKDGTLDLVWGSCRYFTFGGYYAQGEIGIDGKSKQADDTNGLLKSSGKMPGMFARVVPAGTALKSYRYLGDLFFVASTGGTTGNSITIRYTAGATAGAEVVTVAGSAITVQISDTISTAQQIKTAIEANVSASSLVSCKIIGTSSNQQSIILTPSAVSLANGAAASAKDAGYFIMARRNVNADDNILTNTSYSFTWEVLFSKDLSDPDSFSHVNWFENDLKNDVGIIGDRAVIELSDYYQNGEAGLLTKSYSANTQWSSVGSTRSILAGNAHLISGAVQFFSLATGSDGNRAHRIKLQTGIVAGSETATISGKDITISIQQGVTTVQQIKNAIEANSAVAAVIKAEPYSTNTLSTAQSSIHDFFNLNSGVTHWPHEGLWGFGYCNINEFSFIQNSGLCSTSSTLKKTPRGWPNEMMVETFRVSKLT